MLSILLDIALGAFTGVLITCAIISIVGTCVSAIEWVKTHNYED